MATFSDAFIKKGVTSPRGSGTLLAQLQVQQRNAGEPHEEGGGRGCGLSPTDLSKEYIMFLRWGGTISAKMGLLHAGAAQLMRTPMRVSKPP